MARLLARRRWEGRIVGRDLAGPLDADAQIGAEVGQAQDLAANGVDYPTRALPCPLWWTTIDR
jgi:hypothetical protein